MEKTVGLVVAACLVLVAASWFAPRMAARQAESTAVEAPARMSSAVVEPSVGGGAASISRAADGHYWAQASVDGRAVLFLVDTGASTVALTQAEARRLGLQPERLRYDVPIRTANGEAMAAAVTLDSVSVAGVRVEDVEALVSQDAAALEVSLLGMTYLGRLSRFEATPRALILRR